MAGSGMRFNHDVDPDTRARVQATLDQLSRGPH
jgi:hypothetical protein